MRERYSHLFAFAIALVTGGAAYAFSRISAEPPPPPVPQLQAAGREGIAPRIDPIAPPLEAYERYAAEDAAWRKLHARPLGIAEWSARGDWRSKERQALDDRVHDLSRRGRHAQAITLLERWLTKHPRDQEALLALARLLSRTERTEEAIVRYRRLLAIKGGGS